MQIHTLSRILQPKIIVPPGRVRGSEITSLSQKLLTNLGLVRPSNGATNTLLPLAVRVLEKLTRLIKEELTSVGAQEISLPALTAKRLLKETGRDELPELFNLTDRHRKQFVLSPTHEEAVVNLLSSIKPTYKQLPLLLFQITSKFRDEIKPRFGLMRAKEFLMKDLYCFDTSPESSLVSYKKINDCYRSILAKLSIPFCCVEGSTGEIGGSLSHEFHILSQIGEDKVLLCKDCGHGINCNHSENNLFCGHCKSSRVAAHNAIEVGHSFLLGTRYSKPLKAVYAASDNSQQYLEMSCHGIGLSRLLAAAVEVLSSQQAIRWPSLVAPFSACLIPPKAGSKEERTEISSTALYMQLAEVTGNDVVLDDRTELTIGKRLDEAKAMGYPYIIVIGKAAVQNPNQLEIHDIHSGTTELVPVPNLLQVLKLKISQSN